jgi:hypothetical protein
MIRKYTVVLSAALVVWVVAAGCASSSFAVTPHIIRVVDASSKQPIPNASVTVRSAAATASYTTDERGVARVGGYVGTEPKVQSLEVAMLGYATASRCLSGGLPHRIEIALVPSHP